MLSDANVEVPSANNELSLLPNSGFLGVRLGLVTTWATRCGIAEYSRCLAVALAARGVRVSVFAQRRTDPAYPDSLVPSQGHTTVRAVWDFGQVDPAAVIQICQHASIGALSVQYHHGFFGPDHLLALARAGTRAGIEVAITFHHSRHLDIEYFHRLDRLGVSCLVHTEAERQRLVDLGVVNVSATSIGAPEAPDEPAEEARRRLGLFLKPVVGTFGFFRPHKGVLQLIEAASILQQIYPEVTLLCLNAVYPDADSETYLAECRQAVQRCRLEQQVLLATGFQDLEQTIADLHACDVIILPYHASQEGSSAAAHTALAARRPLLTTRQAVFEGLEGVVYPVESPDPPVLAAALATVLGSPFLQESLRRRGAEYLAHHSWADVAQDYLRVLFPPSDLAAD